jgi:trehalose 6-phosphate synthase
LYRSLDRSELVALYQVADVALITPLKDGMNLIAKEYCASHVNGDGVLILSEFAGAATQLGQQALLVNPYDINGVSDAIHQACTMNPEERRTRMAVLRQIIRARDIFWWLNTFLDVALAKGRHGASSFKQLNQTSGAYDQQSIISPTPSIN